MTPVRKPFPSVFFLLAGLGLITSPLPALSVILPPDPNHTALHAAAETGEPAKVRQALKDLPFLGKKDRINLLDREGLTPLAYAARGGSLESVNLLVAAGAAVDLTEKNSGWTPLMRAAEQWHADVVRHLLEHGAKPNVTTSLGKTPLAAALAGSLFAYGPKGDRLATVKILLEKGADPSQLLQQLDDLTRKLNDQQKLLKNLDEERRRIEEERRRLIESLDRIRSETGNPGYRPTGN